MPIGARVKSASVVVAALVTALAVVPAMALEQGSDPGTTSVVTLAKQTTRPRPHETPTAAPKATPKEATATTRPASATDRPAGGGDANADATKLPGKGEAKEAPSSSEPAPVVLDDTDKPLPAGATASNGPGPDVLALGVGLAGILGLGWVRMLASRRRREADLEPARLAAVAAQATVAKGWKDLALEDDEQLPRWLRASGRRAPLETADRAERAASAAPGERAARAGLLDRVGPSTETSAWTPPPLTPSRQPLKFAAPVGASAMRLVVTDSRCELYDQPDANDAWVLAELGAGDEVEILDIAEPWVKVETPLGHAGWIRSTSLGV
jgi:hypothetical protein